jgi:hypothetical protein
MSKARPMYFTIIKRLTLCFLFSTALTIIPFSIYYQSENEFVAKNALSGLLIIATMFNLLYYVLSWGGMFNLKQSIRNDVKRSFYSFFTLPTALFFVVLFYSITRGTSFVDYAPLVPSVIYLITLYYHFSRFRKTVDERKEKDVSTNT